MTYAQDERRPPAHEIVHHLSTPDGDVPLVETVPDRVLQRELHDAPPAGEVEPGAVVRLKSGGPPMLMINALSDGDVMCAWVEGERGIVRQGFAVAVLDVLIPAGST